MNRPFSHSFSHCEATQQPELKSQIAKTVELFRQCDTFLITSCASPDGDSIASQLILWQLLRQIKDGQEYRVDMISERPCPPVYSFLEGSRLILPLAQAKPLSSYQVGMVTDGGPERTGQMYPYFQKCATRILVDHHLVGSQENCQIHLVDPKAASTCELLYHFFSLPKSGLRLTPELAAMFYVGIIFDTGAFQYNLTTPFTHRIAADLLATGIPFSQICEKVLLEHSLTARRLQGKVLSSFRTALDGSLAWSKIDKALALRLRLQPGDMEGLVNMINFTHGVEMAILFSEMEQNLWKISFRSRGKCNVANLARSLTKDGGGHERAAGCSLSGDYRQISRRVLNAAKTALRC